MAADEKPDWVDTVVLDAVTVALKRAGYEGVPKADLQEMAGAGASDTRVVLMHLGEKGLIETTPDGDGYRWVDEDAGSPIADMISGADPAQPDEDDPDAGLDDDEREFLAAESDDDPAEAAALRRAFGESEPALAAAEAPGGEDGRDPLGFDAEGVREVQAAAQGGAGDRYAATIAVEIQFGVAPEAERTNDGIAASDAAEMASVVRDAIERQYPGVVSSAYVAGLEVYARTRVVPVR